MFGQRQLPRNLEAALRDAKDDRPAVRAAAVRDLVAHAEGNRPRVLATLESALADASPDVRVAAATALADVEGREAVSALLDAVDDRATEVAAMAIAALGEIGDERAKERVERALGDKRAEVRFQAVIAFPRLAKDREAAMTALLTATRDADDKVCHIALRVAEEQIGDDDPLDPRLVARAEAMIERGAPEVRVAAAVILARFGDAKKSRRVLVDLARGELATHDGGDEAAAIELCGELALTDATKALERRAFGGALGLRKDKFAWHARVALARMGHERAVKEILAELASWDRDRRALATAAAGRARIAAAKPILESLRARGDDRAVIDEALAALDAARETTKEERR